MAAVDDLKGSGLKNVHGCVAFLRNFFPKGGSLPGLKWFQAAEA